MVRIMTLSPVSDKRQHVVETAYALFKRAGFHATGIDRIIAEADVAKMTMYRHFPSKDELIVAVLDYRARRFDDQLNQLAQKSITPEQKIAEIFDWHGRWFRSPDFHGCLFAHALAEFGDPGHPVFEAVARQKNGLRQRMRSILSEVLPRGRAENVAATLLMLIEGATLMAQMGQTDTALREARKTALDVVAASRRKQ
ncbi:TetR family transcriptional regulator [Mesorhizobium sp. 131-3-5]|nr:TetR family transcriptional regulator [Mesorhizobium sp. 131-3-5]